MQSHHRSLDNVFLESSAVTIGFFDGVHLGHQLIIRQLNRFAKQHQIPSVIITFFPHPLFVLKKTLEPFYLTYPEERAEILLGYGIDQVITLRFTKTLSEFSPERFMRWISSHLGVKYLCIGEDFALGKDRKGNPATLAKIGDNLGYKTQIMPPALSDSEKISSSRIRKLLRAGEITKANQLLGRHFSLTGSGKLVSDPNPENPYQTTIEFTCKTFQLLPAAGVYTSIVTAKRRSFYAIATIDAPSPDGINQTTKPKILLQFPDGQEPNKIDGILKISILLRLNDIDETTITPLKIKEIMRDIEKFRAGGLDV